MRIRTERLAIRVSWRRMAKPVPVASIAAMNSNAIAAPSGTEVRKAANSSTIRPKVIVALGTFAAKSMLKSTESISRLRGRMYDYRGAKLVPTFHPAFLLRNPNCRREVWEDMKKVRALLNGEAGTTARQPGGAPEDAA